jgi:hypothetical protein
MIGVLSLNAGKELHRHAVTTIMNTRTAFNSFDWRNLLLTEDSTVDKHDAKDQAVDQCFEVRQSTRLNDKCLAFTERYEIAFPSTTRAVSSLKLHYHDLLTFFCSLGDAPSLSEADGTVGDGSPNDNDEGIPYFTERLLIPESLTDLAPFDTGNNDPKLDLEVLENYFPLPVGRGLKRNAKNFDGGNHHEKLIMARKAIAIAWNQSS